MGGYSLAKSAIGQSVLSQSSLPYILGVNEYCRSLNRNRQVTGFCCLHHSVCQIGAAGLVRLYHGDTLHVVMQQYFAELCHDVKIRLRAARQDNLSTGISSVKIGVGKGAAICRDQQMCPMVV